MDNVTKTILFLGIGVIIGQLIVINNYCEEINAKIDTLIELKTEGEYYTPLEQKFLINS